MMLPSVVNATKNPSRACKKEEGSWYSEKAVINHAGQHRVN